MLLSVEVDSTNYSNTRVMSISRSVFPNTHSGRKPFEVLHEKLSGKACTIRRDAGLVPSARGEGLSLFEVRVLPLQLESHTSANYLEPAACQDDPSARRCQVSAASDCCALSVNLVS